MTRTARVGARGLIPPPPLPSALVSFEKATFCSWFLVRSFCETFRFAVPLRWRRTGAGTSRVPAKRNASQNDRTKNQKQKVAFSKDTTADGEGGGGISPLAPTRAVRVTTRQPQRTAVVLVNISVSAEDPTCGIPRTTVSGEAACVTRDGGRRGGGAQVRATAGCIGVYMHIARDHHRKTCIPFLSSTATTFNLGAPHPRPPPSSWPRRGWRRSRRWPSGLKKTSGRPSP